MPRKAYVDAFQFSMVSSGYLLPSLLELGKTAYENFSTSIVHLTIFVMRKNEQFLKFSSTSIQNSPVSGSLATVAVRPAAEDDFPDV